MNKILSLLSICLLIAFSISSCKKKSTTNNNNNSNNDIVVDIDRTDTTSLPYAINPLPLSLDLTSPPFGPIQMDTFATKVDEYITPYGFTKNDIIKVNLTKLNMVIENAPGQTFNFVKDTLISIKVYVDSFTGTAPKLVASKAHITPNSNSIVFDVETDDIKDYFRADYMKISVAFRTQENEGLDAASKFRVNYTFRVTAKKP